MKQSVPFTGLSLSGFCMQISILLKSAVPLYEGLSVMAEDASSPREKEILTAMSDKLRMGFPFSEAVSEAGCFPAYVTQMTVLGERTGTLDETMEHLSRFYEREYRLGGKSAPCRHLPRHHDRDAPCDPVYPVHQGDADLFRCL